MKIFLIIVSVFVLSGVGYFVLQKTPFPTTKPVQPVVTKITAEQAVEKVRSLTEVREYLERVPKGIVEIDNVMPAEYFVHVYEIKDGHTATFNWYKVNNKTGEIVSDLSQ